MDRVTKAPDVRRQEIIDTAIALFCEKGYEHTSMSDISNRMHVSQGLCYRYFKSKEEIYDAALDSYVSEGVEAFKAAFCHANKSFEEKLDGLISMDERRTGEDFFNRPENTQFHMQMQVALCDKLFPIVVNEMRSALAAGEIDVDCPEALAAFCLYGQLGVWANLEASNEQKLTETKKIIKTLLF